MSKLSSPTKPDALPVNVDSLPADFHAMETARFVVWKYTEEVDEKTEEISWDKPPVNARTGGGASSTNPKTWSTLIEAVEAYSRGQLDGIGVVMDKRLDDLVGIDLDDCRDQETGEIAEWAAKIVNRMNTYTEVSPSGRGLRLFVRGTLPPAGRKKGDFEIYNSGRYVTVTGHRLPGTPATIEKRQAEIDAVHAEIFKPANGKPSNGKAASGGTPHNLADAEIVEKASKSKPKFARLWQGDISGYASASEADLALANYLTFWCGPNSTERVQDLMRQSGLFRTKYNRADYLPRTVALAFEGRTEFYAGNGSVHIRKAKGKAAAADGPPVAVELPEPDPQPTPPPPSTGGEKRAEPVAGRSCREIIRDYLRDHFLPVFKRPGCFFSSRLGREVKKVEALDLITNGELLTQLALAVDAPKTKDQAGDYVADPDKLPGAVRKWAPFGYGDVMLTLPVEVEADEISDLAQEDFRRLVARGLNRLVGMGRVEDEGTRSQQTIIETRRVIEWAMEFGTRSTWQPARSYLIWARRGEGRVHIAICADLFAQVGLPQLADLGTKKFPELARRYGVVVPPQSGDEPRARGGDDKKQRRILELTEDFQAELLGPVCDGVTV